MYARYTTTAIALHWLIALLLLGQFAFGLLLEDIPRGTPARGAYVNLHKSSGILIGLLILVRIAWRLTHKPPPLPATMPSWQRHAAKASHLMLYLCMIMLPLSGYLASNFSKYGIKFFNLVHWQPWGPDDKTWYALFNQTHHLAALLLAVFVILHVLAVAKHLLIDRNGLLRRMWPARAARGTHSFFRHFPGDSMTAARSPSLLPPAPARALAIALALCMSLLATPWAAAQSASKPASATPLAYVPNEGSATVSVIDTNTDQVIAELPGGSKPRGLAVSTDRRWLYVSDQPHNSLQLVDLGARKLGNTIALGESPEGVAISPDGRWVAAAVEGKNEIAVTDTRSNALAFSIKVQGKNPEHAVFSPNGRLLFVSAEEGEAVDIIDFTARKQVAQVAVGARPRGIGFLPDGSRAYIATENANEVFVIDTASFAILARIKAGLRANGIAVHPSGREVYVSNGGDANVSVIDTASNQVVATIPVGQRPWNMALTPDGKKLYVANGRSNTVSVIDTAGRTRLRDVAVGKLPWGVVIR